MAKNDLTEGPVWRALAAVSAPMSFGILAVLSVGIVDAYFLGQLGSAPLAAVGFIYPVTTAITSLAIGLSAGANTVVSQSVGRDDDELQTARLGLHALFLGLALAVAAAGAFWLLAGSLFRLIGAGNDAMAEIHSYVPFWAASFPFLVFMMIINAVFRAHGNGASSALIMMLAAAVNIAINPVLIFGMGPIPAMETAGAALATFVARMTAAVVALGYAIHAGYLRLDACSMRGIASSVGKVLNVGVPAAFSNAINPAGMAAVTAAVATLGEAAVGGFGAAARVQSIVIVPMLALSAGIGPVVGQNWGADHKPRAREAVGLSWAFCLGYGFIVAIALTFFAGPIANAIASGGEAAGYTESYLRIVGWSLFGYGILVTANAAMNARSKAVWSMSLSIARILAVYLPLAWLGVWLFGYTGILAAAVAANLLAVAGAYAAGRATGLVGAGSYRFLPGMSGASRAEAR